MAPAKQRACHYCRTAAALGRHRYCSHRCGALARQRGDGLFCGHCGTHFGARQGCACFCSVDCADEYQAQQRATAARALTKWRQEYEAGRMRGAA
jgi:hypothetical protein